MWVKKQTLELGVLGSKPSLCSILTVWIWTMGLLWDLSPDFLVPGTSFIHRAGWWWWGWVVSGWFKSATFIVHFISIVITSAPPQVIRLRSQRLGTPALEGLVDRLNPRICANPSGQWGTQRALSVSSDLSDLNLETSHEVTITLPS